MSIKKINFKGKKNTRPLGNHEEELRAEDVNHIKEVINNNAEDQKRVTKSLKRHKEDDNLHVTPQEKKDWGEKYSLVVNTAANEIILFKGGKENSKAKIELPEPIPWTDLTLSSGARASRAKYKINMRTVMFDVYNLEIPKTRPFTIFNIPEHLRPEKDRYIGGVVRLTTYETYSLIVKRNGNVMINFPMEKLRNDRFSFTVEYTLD